MLLLCWCRSGLLGWAYCLFPAQAQTHMMSLFLKHTNEDLNTEKAHTQSLQTQTFEVGSLLSRQPAATS